MRKKQMFFILMITSLFLLSATVVQAVDETITDPEDDVFVIGEDFNFTETTDQKPNIDLTQATYTNNAGTATITVTVKGVIENTGSEEALQAVAYTVVIETSGDLYQIIYINENCSMTRGDTFEQEYIAYEIQNQDTLVMTYDLTDAGETFANFTIETTEFSLDQGELYLDIYPNEEVEFSVYADGPSEAETGEEIEFGGNAFFGETPYSWQWSFGNGDTSTEQDPTYTYNQAGTYTVTVQVTDGADNTASDSYEITISGGSNGNGDDGGNNLLLFIIAIIAVVVIGVIVLVVIIRR